MKITFAFILLGFFSTACPAAVAGKGNRAPAPAAATHETRPYSKLDHVVFVSNRADDGDSFHVRAQGKEYIFRLYFVDTPETEDDFPARVDDQAKYFGISHADALRVGKMAAEFTKQHLGGHPFTVQTRWQDARGRSKLERFYAHIYVENKNLAELLVEKGLARISGFHANLPDGTRAGAFEANLRAIEAKAKAAKAGAWGMRGKK